MFFTDLFASAVPVIPFALFTLATVRIASLLVTPVLLVLLGIGRAKVGHRFPKLVADSERGEEQLGSMCPGCSRHARPTRRSVVPAGSCSAVRTDGGRTRSRPPAAQLGARSANAAEAMGGQHLMRDAQLLARVGGRRWRRSHSPCRITPSPPRQPDACRLRGLPVFRTIVMIAFIGMADSVAGPVHHL